MCMRKRFGEAWQSKREETKERGVGYIYIGGGGEGEMGFLFEANQHIAHESRGPIDGSKRQVCR